MQNSQDIGIISLIPKGDKPKELLDSWRPITLLNCIYKLLSGVLANRINKVLPNIIPPIVMPLNLNKTPVYASPVRRRSSAEFNALINNFENLKRISIFDSQKFKNSILESP